jgi:glycerophosphoryl diester phosphodiesterase
MPTMNIAHRGGAGLWPENTVAAFANAAAMGADGAELDVQLSKDGEVVLFHDYKLNDAIVRGADGKWLTRPTPRVKDLTLAELRTYDVGRHDRSKPYGARQPDLKPIDGQRIPTLDEVLAACKKAPKPFILQVELKCDFVNLDNGPTPEALATATVEVLKRNGYLDRTIFVGFHWAALLQVKKLCDAPCWFTAMAESYFRDAPVPPEDDPPDDRALMVLRHWAKTGTSPWAAGFDAVNYGGSLRRAIKAAGGDGWFPTYQDATPEAVAEAKALGLKVGAWTVNEKADMQRLVKLGLDAVCTDRPDVLQKILSES